MHPAGAKLDERAERGQAPSSVGEFLMPTTVVHRSSTGTTCTEQSRTVAILAWLTVVGLIVYVILDVIAQALPPHYSPVRQPESDLAVGPYGWIMTVNFVVRGLLSAALLMALTRTLAPTRRSVIAFILFGIWTAGALLLAVFPTDVSGGTHTVHGGIHVVVALIAFVGISVAESLLSGSLTDNPIWRRLGLRSSLLARLTIACLLVLVVSTVIHSIGGLTERLFLASALLWMLIVALGLRSPTGASQ
jgi:hypothetical membrane protein